MLIAGLCAGQPRTSRGALHKLARWFPRPRPLDTNFAREEAQLPGVGLSTQGATVVPTCSGGGGCERGNSDEISMRFESVVGSEGLGAGMECHRGCHTEEISTAFPTVGSLDYLVPGYPLSLNLTEVPLFL